MKLGRAIRHIRKLKKITQVELGEKIGLSQTALSQIENGEKRPGTKTMEKICAAFEVPVPVLYIMSCELEDFNERDRPVLNKIFKTASELFDYYFNKK